MTTALARGAIVVAWTVILLLAAGYSGLRTNEGSAFESNILGLMPERTDAGGGQALETLAQAGFDRQFVIMLSHPDPDSAAGLAAALRDRLAAQPSIDMAVGQRNPLAELREFFRPYRHQVLAPATRDALVNQHPQSLADALLQELHSPLGGMRLYPVAEDPFNLGGAWLQSLFPEAGRFTDGDLPVLEQGDSRWWLLRGELADSPFDAASQAAVADTLALFTNAHPAARVLRSGLVFHAEEAARTARFEISTVGAGSLLGILILVIVVFRSPQALLAIGFTLLGSTLIALAVSLAVFERVHLVTLAFGTTLLGLAVDYCFHFLVRQQRSGNAGLAGRLIRRGVLFSAGSSMGAYLLQLFSPLPGLQQFAVFMVAGLAGACGSVAVLACLYRGPQRAGFERWLQLYPRYVAPGYLRLARYRRAWFAGLAVAVSLLTLYLVGQGGRDDIRLLNTSSERLLDTERQVRAMLGGPDSQRYLRVSGSSAQQVLERSERLLDTVRAAAVGTPAPLLAAAQMVPSLARQRQDYELVAARLYGPGGALERLCAALASDCAKWRTLPGDFAAGLTPERLPERVADLFPVVQLSGEDYSLMPLRQDGALPLSLRTALEREPGVSYVDEVAGLTATLATLRGEVSLLLGCFVALFAVGSLLLLRRRGLLLLSCVLVPMVVSLALSAGGGVTLFHVMALLLVLGLAVDTAVFYLELGLDGDSWLASTLATMTSILAFGLLSLSRVPVLHYFGTVVFAGLLCSWLATPLLFKLWGHPSPVTRQDADRD